MTSNFVNSNHAIRNGEEPSESKLEQIRELLFGEQARHIEQRLAQVGTELSGTFSEFREEFQKRLSGVAADSSREIESLRAQLSELENSLSDRLDQMRATQEEAVRTWAEHLMTELEDIRSAKVNRSDLSEFLADFAQRLAPPAKQEE